MRNLYCVHVKLPLLLETLHDIMVSIAILQIDKKAQVEFSEEIH